MYVHIFFFPQESHLALAAILYSKEKYKISIEGLKFEEGQRGRSRAQRHWQGGEQVFTEENLGTVIFLQQNYGRMQSVGVVLLFCIETM